MNKQVIITKAAGHDIPRGYLQVALKECPTYFGMAVQDKVEGEAILDHAAEPRTIELDELCKTLAGSKDIPVVLMLGNMQQDFNTETDMMPYTFQVKGTGKDDDPVDVLAVFLEGDFPKYNKPGEGHTDEYNLWEEYLYPTILEKLEASDDVDDFFRRLRDTSFDKAFKNVIGHRGVAVFVPNEGELIALGDNELGGKFEWGTTSNTFKWGTTSKLEQAATAAVAAVKRTSSRLAQLKGGTALQAPEDPAQGAPEVPGVQKTDAEPKKLNEDKPKDDKTVDVWKNWPGCSAKTHTMRPVPDGLQGNARNRWIRSFLGLAPDNEKDLPKGRDRKGFMIPVANDLVGFAQEDISTNEEVKKLQSRIARFRQGEGVDEDAQPVTDPNQVAKPPAEKPKGDVRPTKDFLPELSADDKKGAVTLVTEWASNAKAPTHLDVQRIESKWPVFTSIMGIKFSDMGRWSAADIKLLGKKHPDALALAFIEMRLKVSELGGFEPSVNTEEQNDKGDKSGAGKTETPAQPGTPAPQSTAPARTSRLAQLKGK